MLYMVKEGHLDTARGHFAGHACQQVRLRPSHHAFRHLSGTCMPMSMIRLP